MWKTYIFNQAKKLFSFLNNKNVFVFFYPYKGIFLRYSIIQLPHHLFVEPDAVKHVYASAIAKASAFVNCPDKFQMLLCDSAEKPFVHLFS